MFVHYLENIKGILLRIIQTIRNHHRFTIRRPQKHQLPSRWTHSAITEKPNKKQLNIVDGNSSHVHCAPHQMCSGLNYTYMWC